MEITGNIFCYPQGYYTSPELSITRPLIHECIRLLGLPYKIPQTGWLKGQKIFSQLWRTEVQDQKVPGSRVVRILGFHSHGPVSVPGQGTEIPQARWQSQEKNTRVGFW